MNQLPQTHQSGTPPDEMDLFEHLGELRTRLLHSIVAIAVSGIVAFLIAKELFDLLNAPYLEVFKDYPLIGTGSAEAFILKLKVSIFAGLIISSPYLFFQFWLFISPGLHEHERSMFLPFIIATTLCFLGGIVFCYFVVLPFAFEFFLSEYLSIGVTPTIRISEHLSMMIKALLGFGIVFELPVLSFILARLGIIDDVFLKTYFRHAIIVIFVIAAVLTPPDVLTQILMAIPLIILYGFSIFVAKLASGQRKKSSPLEDDKDD